MKPKAQEDRRQYTRYETDLKIQFFVSFDIKTKINFQIKDKSRSDFLKVKYKAISRNISAEGLSFLSDKNLVKGDILALEVYVPSSTEPISMRGEVRWSVESAKKNEYEAGVKLTEVEGQNVEKSIIMDPIHHVAWSIVLETVFGQFKHLMLKKSALKKLV